MFRRGRGPRAGSIYSFIMTWVILSFFFPLYKLSSLLLVLGLGFLVAFLVGRASGMKSASDAANAQAAKAPRKTVDTTVRKVGEQKAEPPAKKPVEKKKNQASLFDF